MIIILSLGRLTQEDHELQASLHYKGIASLMIPWISVVFVVTS
jgi:hypothetical protein